MNKWFTTVFVKQPWLPRVCEIWYSYRQNDRTKILDKKYQAKLLECIIRQNYKTKLSYKSIKQTSKTLEVLSLEICCLCRIIVSTDNDFHLILGLTYLYLKWFHLKLRFKERFSIQTAVFTLNLIFTKKLSTLTITLVSGGNIRPNYQVQLSHKAIRHNYKTLMSGKNTA